MKKKVVWGVVSGWMVAALLLASCAPAVTEEEAVPKEEVALEKGAGPQYGGTLNIAVSGDMTSTWDATQYLTLTPHTAWTRMLSAASSTAAAYWKTGLSS